MKPRINVSRLFPIELFIQFVALTALILHGVPAAAQDRTVIAADAGGTGYLANTLPALALAATSDLDFIELQLVATKDDKLVVFHSVVLDPATDVAEIFPDRAREDGHYYVIDFTLDEIRRLRRIVPEESQAPSLGIPSFSEALSLLRTLETDLRKKVGIAPNIVLPQFHQAEKKDISILVLAALQKYGYNSADQAVLLQSLDGDELQRLSKELMPAMQMQFPLLQRIDRQIPEEESEADKSPSRYDQTWMFTRLGLRVISSYAVGIAFHSSHLVDAQGNPVQESLISDARALGLKIFAFPLESAPPEGLPAFAAGYPELLDHYWTKLRVDGIITASPGLTSQPSQQTQAAPQKEAAPVPAPDLPPFSYGPHDSPGTDTQIEETR